MDNILAAKIEEVFASLTMEDQHKMLIRLNSQTKSSGAIIEFYDEVQKRFGLSPTCVIMQNGPPHSPTITAVVSVPFGDYSGEGPNKSIAKANACIEAKKAWPKFPSTADVNK